MLRWSVPAGHLHATASSRNHLPACAPPAARCPLLVFTLHKSHRITTEHVLDVLLTGPRVPSRLSSCGARPATPTPASTSPSRHSPPAHDAYSPRPRPRPRPRQEHPAMSCSRSPALQKPPISPRPGRDRATQGQPETRSSRALCSTAQPATRTSPAAALHPLRALSPSRVRLSCYQPVCPPGLV